MIRQKAERQFGYLRSLAELIVKSKSLRSIWSRTSYRFVDFGRRFQIRPVNAGLCLKNGAERGT